MRPVVLAVDAARLHAEGRPFWRADDGVWLTGPVPPAFLSEVPRRGSVSAKR